MIMILIGKNMKKQGMSKAWFYFSVLRKLTVNGFVEPHKNMEVMVSKRSHFFFCNFGKVPGPACYKAYSFYLAFIKKFFIKWPLNFFFFFFFLTILYMLYYTFRLVVCFQTYRKYIKAAIMWKGGTRTRMVLKMPWYIESVYLNLKSSELLGIWMLR